MLASRLAQITPGAGSTGAADAARPDPHAVPTATEIVTRPDGLRRGVWEGKPWIFWTVGILVVVVAALWALRRLGVLGRSK